MPDFHAGFKSFRHDTLCRFIFKAAKKNASRPGSYPETARVFYTAPPGRRLCRTGRF